MSQERFFQLLGRKMAGEATIQELAELDKLVLENEEWKILVEQLMIQQPRTTDQDELEADTAFVAHSVKMRFSGAPTQTVPLHRGKNLLKWTMRIAATVVILIAGIYTFKWLGNNETLRSNEQPKQEPIVTQKGMRSRTLLADGTTVWLNAESKLSYDNDFKGSTREVTLDGEAFFDVVQQTNRPFIVHASGIDIKVLGTAFNVRAYSEDKNVEATLFRGSIEVFRQNDSTKNGIRLKPNHKLRIPKQEANENLKLSKDKTQLVKENSRVLIFSFDSTKKESERMETAWMYGRLEFRGSFVELAKKMERWYNVDIIFTDEKVTSLDFYGSFGDETVEEAFAALKEAFPITYKISNDTIFVGALYPR